MPYATPALSRLLTTLERHAALSPVEREAVLSLSARTRLLPAHAHLYREGEGSDDCCVLLDGYAFRYKLTSGGGRQILALLMRGDVAGHEASMLGRSDHGVETLGRAEVAFIPSAALEGVLAAHPAIARAFWANALHDAAVAREWIVNVGRRDARARLAHLLCELGLRHEEAGLGSRERFPLPLTQTQLADCAGLTPVHVNRVLQQLRAEQLIASDGRTVLVRDWDRLRAVADFRPAYLRDAEPDRSARAAGRAALTSAGLSAAS